ncbi:hypothetical protein BX667DRAFT_503487 [Coemansia mojavensis]|nr:hypothetical protein BX667DRAFT_503487 [Coemansia mojavensis]
MQFFSKYIAIAVLALSATQVSMVSGEPQAQALAIKAGDACLPNLTGTCTSGKTGLICNGSIYEAVTCSKKGYHCSQGKCIPDLMAYEQVQPTASVPPAVV